MSRSIRGTAVAIAITLVASGGIAQVASAAAPVTIHESDLIAKLSDTRTAGHVAFRSDGLRVWTDNATNQAKAAEYFAMSGPIPTSASLDWTGTRPQPGQQIVFDADCITGNGNDYNILVGEPVYGANWWLTNGSSADAKAADPSGSNDGGNGSAYFGTLADWAAALPDARVIAGGFSLGSGVQGEGVIDSITYGATTYRFSNQEPAMPAAADVRGFSNVTVGQHSVRVDLTSKPQPANTVLGNKLVWKIKVDGQLAFTTRQGFGDQDTFRRSFTIGSGKHVVDVYKNGVLARETIVRF